MRQLIRFTWSTMWTNEHDSFDNDEAHITAINQSVIQDTLWVHREAELVCNTSSDRRQ